MPTSLCFNGILDDLICLNEAKYELRNYIDSLPELGINTIGDTAVCNNTNAAFTILNSQNNVEYKVWNNTASAWHATPATGTGGNITIGGAAIIQSTDFTIYATNLETSCETILDTVLHISVYPTLAPSISITSDAIATECAGSVINFTSIISNSGSNPSFEWFVNGIIQNHDSANFTYYGLTLSDTITALVYSDYLCSSVDSVISNQIIIDYTPLVTPTANINISPSGFICFGDTVNLSASAVNGGTSPIYQWYRNGLAVGTNSSVYAANDVLNNDDIFVELISDIACVTADTVESNHVFTDVYDNHNFSWSFDTTVCINDTLTLNTGNGYSYIDYTWYIGATDTLYSENVDIFYGGVSPISVILVVNDDHCTYTDSISVIFDICSFVDELKGDGYQIFPNPATDLIHINTDFAVSSIIMFDGTGKIISNFTNTDNSLIINLQNLSNGLYYIMIKATDGRIISTKFVKNK